MEFTDDFDFKYYDVTEKNPTYIKLSPSSKRKFYHYTNEVGKNGILKNNRLWVTNGYNLKDKSEIKYISKVIDGVIKLLVSNKKDKNDDIANYIFNDILNTLRALRRTYRIGAPISDGDIFILSLTENKNSDYLTKNYCGQSGAIFKFKNDIESIFIKDPNIHQYFSATVIYDFYKQRQIILKDLNEFYRELNYTLHMENSVDYSELTKTIVKIIYMKILNYSFFFKDAEYKDEEEYRVIFLTNDKTNANVIKFRTDKNIPYIEVGFNKDDIFVTNV